MLILPVISIAAAISFNRVARSKGYDSPRYWMIPIAIGASIQILSIILRFLAARLVDSNAQFFWIVYPPMVGFLSIVLLIAMIAIGWKSVKALPDRTDRSKQA